MAPFLWGPVFMGTVFVLGARQTGRLVDLLLFRDNDPEIFVPKWRGGH